MANLDRNRTLPLIRDQFYWPKLEDDVRHSLSKVYSCVKTKKSHVVSLAPMQHLSSLAPFALIGIDFYIWTIVVEALCKCIPPPTFLPRLQRIVCMTILCGDMEYLERFYMTRGNNLKILCLHESPNFVE